MFFMYISNGLSSVFSVTSLTSPSPHHSSHYDVENPQSLSRSSSDGASTSAAVCTTDSPSGRRRNTEELSGVGSDRSARRKRNTTALEIAVMNVALMSLLILAYSKSEQLILVTFVDMIFSALACLGIYGAIVQLLILNAVYKGLFLLLCLFMLCYITDGVVNRRGDADFLSTELMIWLSFAIFCTLLELRLMYSMSALFRWCERSESTKPPPKYSKCVRGSNKKRSIEYLPTYAEAIKAIDKQKKAERHKSSYMPHLSAMKDAPIFTLQHTEDIRHLSFPTRSRTSDERNELNARVG